MESVATRSKTRPLSLVTDGSSFVILDSDDYKSVKNRIATFQNWSGALNPDELARTGFICRNQGDETQCVYCNIIIEGWKSFNSSVNEHSRHSPNCEYVTDVIKQLCAIK